MSSVQVSLKIKLASSYQFAIFMTLQYRCDWNNKAMLMKLKISPIRHRYVHPQERAWQRQNKKKSISAVQNAGHCWVVNKLNIFSILGLVWMNINWGICFCDSKRLLIFASWVILKFIYEALNKVKWAIQACNCWVWMWGVYY